MTSIPLSTVDAALTCDYPSGIRDGLTGDLSGLSHLLRQSRLDVLRPLFTKLTSSHQDKVRELQRTTRDTSSTLAGVCGFLHNLIEAAEAINGNGKRAILRNRIALSDARRLVQEAIECCKSLQWEDADNLELSSWRKSTEGDPPNARTANAGGDSEWLDWVLFKPIDDVVEIAGSAFQIALVYQHLRYFFCLDTDKGSGWRTVRTPVLCADDGDDGGLRMVLTVSLKPCPVQAFIPDYRYFGLTELKRSKPDFCLLHSAQRCWKAAGVNGYLGVWRLEHGTIGEENDGKGSTVVDTSNLNQNGAKTVTHLYGRSFEAAFVCCLRAAAGNAYDDKLSEITSGDEYTQRVNAHARRELLQVDPLSPTTAISAMLGEFDHDQTDIKDIPLVAVGGVPQKLCEARGTEITQVVFASNQWTDESVALLDGKSRLDYEKSLLGDQQPENRSVLQWSTAGTIGEALDALLVRSRWLKAWQRDVRENWLKRWECRPKDANGNFVHGGARAPRDDAPGPDDMNLPRQTEQA
jgi:hypothetical protein